MSIPCTGAWRSRCGSSTSPCSSTPVSSPPPGTSSTEHRNSKNLPDLPRPEALDDAPPLGPFRTFQAPIQDITTLTGLDLTQLTGVDRMPIGLLHSEATG